MPSVIPEDIFLLVADGRLYLQNLDIYLTSVPKQYCIEQVEKDGKKVINQNQTPN